MNNILDNRKSVIERPILKSKKAAKVPVHKSNKRWNFILIIVITLCVSCLFGYGVARYLQPPWFEFKPVENDFRASFRQEPLVLRVPVTSNWSDEIMQTVTVRGYWGLDEINKLTNVQSAEGDKLWLEETLKQSGAELKSGDPSDFTAYLANNNVWIRGRILFSPRGGKLYRIWIFRVTEEELIAPSAIRFLYGIKFDGENKPA